MEDEMAQSNQIKYFPYELQISARAWESLSLQDTATAVERFRQPRIMFFRELADRMNSALRPVQPVSAGRLNLYAILLKALRYVISNYADEQNSGALVRALAGSGFACDSPPLRVVLERFGDIFPGTWISTPDSGGITVWLGVGSRGENRQQLCAIELIILSLSAENPALGSFRPLFDDTELAAKSAYHQVVIGVEAGLAKEKPVAPFGLPLFELLRAPVKASPDSLEGQLEYIRKVWKDILPPELMTEMTAAFVVLAEEGRMFAPRGEPGGIDVLEFLKGKKGVRDGYDYPEYERFSPDADWMANVVMLAKMVYVWLDQLSRSYQRPITRLDEIPDEELDRLARWGFTGLWLIGLWERSPASARIKQYCGNSEAIPSAYSLFDYVIAHDLGGESALQELKERCRKRGIRLASDMVPNHTGIYSRWTIDHPDWFIQLDYPPYPSYSFNGPDLSFSPEISLHIEDGYWERRDAAVVFKHYDHRNGRTRYIYHGNDGTSTPWNDTAQLNYLIPEVRESVIRTILHVARQFPIIRFDAAMTLAKKHYQRLWYPQPGSGGIPSRAEHGMTRDDFDRVFPEEFWREVVDRVAAEAPDTLLLAEAFWLMEGYFVRTLGMHRVYNSAFMNMLKMEENAKYRQTIKNVLEYDHRILQRFVNFMNNPDEKTAVEQFGKEGKYFGACVMLVTMPGLPMFGHGQIEGFHEKYGMEYKKAYWEEPVDEHLVAAHERLLFPIMRRRWLFSGSENFVCYDFFVGSRVDENVFAYSNRAGDSRGLVLYNNRYGDSAGWIKSSTAMMRNSGLVQLNLGEALGFNPEGRCYYAFRDAISERDYLRSGMELSEKGLFVELSPYEAHVFLDFKEIRDDDFGTWGRLCHELDGRPVVSLDEEVKQVRHAEVISAFRKLCKDMETSSTTELEPRLTELYELVNRHTGCAGPAAGVTAETLAAIALAERLIALSKADNLPLQEIDLLLPAERLILSGWLILHRMGALAAPCEEAKTAACWGDELGLARPFAELFRETQASEAAPLLIDETAASSLLLALVDLQDLFAGWDPAFKETKCRKLFASAAARTFLHCHKNGGFEWFIKERFEVLIEWLQVIARIRLEASAEAPQQKMASIMEPAAAREMLAKAAEVAGYRIDLLFAAMAGETEEMT
jgi:glycosidase